MPAVGPRRLVCLRRRRSAWRCATAGSPPPAPGSQTSLACPGTRRRAPPAVEAGWEEGRGGRCHVQVWVATHPGCSAGSKAIPCGPPAATSSWLRLHRNTVKTANQGRVEVAFTVCEQRTSSNTSSVPTPWSSVPAAADGSRDCARSDEPFRLPQEGSSGQQGSRGDDTHPNLAASVHSPRIQGDGKLRCAQRQDPGGRTGKLQTTTTGTTERTRKLLVQDHLAQLALHGGHRQLDQLRNVANLHARERLNQPGRRVAGRAVVDYTSQWPA